MIQIELTIAYKPKFYDLNTNVECNLDNNDVERVELISPFLPSKAYLIGFNNDHIEINTYDDNDLYMYCEDNKETIEYIYFLLKTDYRLVEHMNNEYTAKFTDCKDTIIDFLYDKSLYCEDNLILRLMQFDDYEDRKVLTYIEYMDDEVKAKILGYNSYKVLNNKYTLYYNS